MVLSVQLDDYFGQQCPVEPEELAGGEPRDNANIALSVLGGQAGPPRDIVCLNAAMAIVAGGKADSIEQGWQVAQASIDNGNALKAMKKLVELTVVPVV